MSEEKKIESGTRIKDAGKHFLLDESDVKEINALLAKYHNCADCNESGRSLSRKGGCDGCSAFMTNDEVDAAWELTEAFRECMSLGILRGGKTMNIIEMKDVPREVWDEIYAKWQRALNVGWRHSMWTGCSLCVWMAHELGVRRMRDVDCEACPLYEGEWCRTVPEDSKIHPEYCNDGLLDVEPWEDRVKEFLEFIKPYCSKDENLDIKGDILEYIRVNGDMYDMVGISMKFSSLPAEEVYSIINSLVLEGMVEKGYNNRNIYALRVTEDGENA